ncbi:hypothetical protein GF373_08840 [bacterium]|nr:hypothetical protein [bacterium]
MCKVKGWIGLLMACLLLPVASHAIEPVKEINIPAETMHLAYPYLFVGGTGKLNIYDISDGGNPQKVGGVDIKNEVVMAVTVVGDRAFVALDKANEENFVIVDISNINQPWIVDTRFAGEQGLKPYSLYADGRDIYVGMTQGINVIHLNEDNTLVQLGYLDRGDDIFGMISIGNVLYATSWWWEFYIIDKSDPTNLQLLDTVMTDFANNKMDIDGNLLAIAEGENGISLYNINDPKNPQFLQTVYTGQNENFSVDLRQNFCYVARMYYHPNDVTAPPREGGLTILDYEFMNNIQVEDTDEVHDALDVIAYNGYVYLAGIDVLNVYRHGPLGDRPTSTPTRPTPTHTPTVTNTPTNTPRLIATATPKDQQPTPTFTHTPTSQPLPQDTPTFTPVPTHTPTLTPTPVPGQPTPTQAPAGEADFVFEFSDSNLADGGWTDQFLGGFSGNPGGFAKTIPLSGEYFPQSTDERGLMLMVSPVQDSLNEVCFIASAQGIDTQGYPAFIRAYVRAEDDGGNAELYVGALKGSFTQGGLDGSIAFNSPKNSSNFTNSQRVNCYYVPDGATTYITPFIQFAATDTGGDATIYVDRIEVYLLKPGMAFDGSLFAPEY